MTTLKMPVTTSPATMPMTHETRLRSDAPSHVPEALLHHPQAKQDHRTHPCPIGGGQAAQSSAGPLCLRTLGVASLLNARPESLSSRAPSMILFVVSSSFEDTAWQLLPYVGQHACRGKRIAPHIPQCSPADARSPERKHRHMDSPDTQPIDIAQFLDLHDSDSEDKDDKEAPFVIMQQDLGHYHPDFIDDDTRYPESVPLLSKHTLEQREVGDLEELAVHYEKEASSYTQSAAMELDNALELSDTTHDLTQHPGLHPAMEEAIILLCPTQRRLLCPPSTRDGRPDDTPTQTTGPCCPLPRHHPKRDLDPLPSQKAGIPASICFLIEAGFQIIAIDKPLCQAAYPRTYPTIEEVAPFFVVYDQFEDTCFVGPAFYLQAGDCVIISEGQRTGDHFYILKVHNFLLDVTAKEITPAPALKLSSPNSSPTPPCFSATGAQHHTSSAGSSTS
ncbi:hypothetical protein B0H17DRAFT_1138990 [Mycena rosella]|uniref:Uncharacterized protein n=1 Tax=Mycena rosella TaxID=1033263 RepID=A0AAD7D5N2_MYCRO|nr:hypothetical protein B0H17DRAFT_1138990 [Mycena rosella]